MSFSTARRRSGFTLVELLIVLALMGMMTGFLMVNFPQMIARTRILTSAQQVGALFQRTRLEAVRRNEAGEVTIVGNRAQATIGTLRFETRLESGVEFRAPAGEDVVDGFGADGKVLFRIDGTVQEKGAFRLAGDRNYFVEVRIDPPATARVEILKWDANTTTFRAQGEEGQSWEW